MNSESRHTEFFWISEAQWVICRNYSNRTYTYWQNTLIEQSPLLSSANLSKTYQYYATSKNLEKDTWDAATLATYRIINQLQSVFAIHKIFCNSIITLVCTAKEEYLEQTTLSITNA